MAEQRRMITQQPENSETPLESACTWVTPTRLFFVRNHAPIPALNPDTWTLKIDGRVSEPLEFNYKQLQTMPQRSISVTVECAGNGRSFLAPHVHGVQWGAGAIAHAEWTGVPLAKLLEKTRLAPDVSELVFEGADRCSESDHPEPMPFARSLPLDKALHPDTLIALSMNGEALEPDHGFPARLLVPGWYGVASVKWLQSISAVAQPFRGYFQSTKYTYRVAGAAEPAIVQQMKVKSEIIRPQPNDVLSAGTQRIAGVAWAGEEAVQRVDVSTDGGQTWHQANLVGPSSSYSWIMWEYYWEEMQAGEYTLMARATSAGGQQQPLQHDPLCGGYMINFVRPCRVRIQPAAEPVEAPATWDAAALTYDMNAFSEQNARLPLDVELELIGGAGI